MKTNLQLLQSLKRKTAFNVLQNKFLKILGYSQLIVFLLLSFSISNYTNASISISVSNITSSGCKVSWSAVPGATKYEVTVRYRRCDDIFGCWKNFPSCDKIIVSSTSLTVTGINSQPDESPNHFLRRIVDVKAFNQMTEIESDYKEFYVLVPGPRIEIISPTNTSLTVDLFQEKSKKYEYKINVQSTNGDVWSNLTGYPKTLTSGTETQKITGLTPGTSYRLLLQYYYYGGSIADQWSDWSEKIVPTLPNAPTALAAKNVEQNFFTPNWSNVTGATSFKIYLKEKQSGKIILNGFETISPVLLRDLEPGTQYEYQITALNESGESAKSNAILVTTTTHPIPVAYAADNITCESFRARWSSVAGASGYRLEVNDGNVVKFIETGGLVYTVDQLNSGFQYKYKVRALFNSNTGFSNQSNEIAVTTQACLTLLHTPAGSGTVSGYGTYAPGSTVTIQAISAAGYVFSHWSETGVGNVSTAAQFTFVITKNRILTAAFTPVNYLLSLSANPAGGGTVAGDGSYVSGTSVTAKATAAKGYEFVNWTEGGKEVSKSASYVFSISANRTLVANFKSITPVYKITLSANPTEGGTVTGGGNFEQGTSVTISASPKTGYDFVGWMNGTNFISSSVNYVFLVTANVTYTANFKPKSWLTLSLAADPSTGGSITGAGSFEPGSQVTIKAIPETGYEFVNWVKVGSGAEVSKAATYTFTITENIALTAKFKATTTAYLVNLSPNPAAGGVVTGGGQFISGKSVTVSATAVKGYEFVHWTEGTSVVSTQQNYTFSLSGNKTLTAVFALNTPVTELKSDDLKLYPNPVVNVLNLEGIEEETSLRIFDLTGTLIKNTQITGDGEFEVSFLNSGIYLFIFENSTIKSTRKIVKK